MKAPNARPSWQPPPPYVLDVVWLASFEHARRRAWETNLDTFTMKKLVLRFRPARGVFCDTTSGSPLVTMRTKSLVLWVNVQVEVVTAAEFVAARAAAF